MRRVRLTVFSVLMLHRLFSAPLQAAPDLHGIIEIPPAYGKPRLTFLLARAESTSRAIQVLEEGRRLIIHASGGNEDFYWVSVPDLPARQRTGFVSKKLVGIIGVASMSPDSQDASLKPTSRPSRDRNPSNFLLPPPTRKIGAYGEYEADTEIRVETKRGPSDPELGIEIRGLSIKTPNFDRVDDRINDVLELLERLVDSNALLDRAYKEIRDRDRERSQEIRALRSQIEGLSARKGGAL